MLKLQFKNNPNRGFWLVGDQLTIGTNAGCHVVLEGLGVFDQHAVIQINGESLTLEPATGVHCLVNNKMVTEPQALHCNDEIRMGVDVLVVVDPKNQSKPSCLAIEPVALPSKQWSMKAVHPKLHERLFELEGRHVIGRSKDVDISIPYKLLSRQHAELTVLDDGLMLQDLSSSNGCFVNGERVTECLLKGGETIKLANLEFTVIAPHQKVSAAVPINATMIRQAVSDEDIKQAQKDHHQRRARESKQLSSIESNDNHDSPQYGVWLSVLALLIISLGAAWWYF